jgi:hypothetical protein
MKTMLASATAQAKSATFWKATLKKAIGPIVIPPVRFVLDRAIRRQRFRNYIRRQEWLRQEQEAAHDEIRRQILTECDRLQQEKERMRQESDEKLQLERERIRHDYDEKLQLERGLLRQSFDVRLQQEKERLREDFDVKLREEKEHDYLQRLLKDRFSLHNKWWGGSPWLENRPQSKFLFIVGCGHSGTTILLRILSEHPAIHGIPKESSLFYKESDSLILQGLLEWDAKARLHGKSVILEKTPDHLFSINKINEFVPRSHIVCVVRDGRDVVASLLARGWEYERAMVYWLSHMQYLEEAKAKCANLTIIKLEDLVARPSILIAEILGVFGLENSPGIVDYLLRYHERPVTHYYDKVELPENGLEGENQGKLRNYQIHQPLFKETSRWRRDLSPEMQGELTEKLGYWLNEYGYLEDEVRQHKAA